MDDQLSDQSSAALGPVGLLTLRAGTEIHHEIEVKRSRFLTTLARTDDPRAARALIDRVKSTYPDARHHCSAFLIHQDGRNPIQHSSDDGEPAGTAGIPMLEALKGAGTWNVTAVVTRYFGGVLLGAGGLIRAYSTATSEALALAPRAIRRPLAVMRTSLAPADAGRIEADLRAQGYTITDVSWGSEVSLSVAIDEAGAPGLVARLAELSAGSASFHEAGRTIVEVDVAEKST